MVFEKDPIPAVRNAMLRDSDVRPGGGPLCVASLLPLGKLVRGLREVTKHRAIILNPAEVTAGEGLGAMAIRWG